MLKRVYRNTSADTAMRVAANMAEINKEDHEQLISFIPESIWDIVLNMTDEEIGILIRDQILYITSDGEVSPKFISKEPNKKAASEIMIENTKKYMLKYKTVRRTTLARMKKELTTAHAPEIDGFYKSDRIPSRYRRKREMIDDVIANAPKMPRIVLKKKIREK